MTKKPPLITSRAVEIFEEMSACWREDRADNQVVQMRRMSADRLVPDSGFGLVL